MARLIVGTTIDLAKSLLTVARLGLSLEDGEEVLK
jgi:hypothetical protein